MLGFDPRAILFVLAAEHDTAFGTDQLGEASAFAALVFVRVVIGHWTSDRVFPVNDLSDFSTKVLLH